ncbi:hypothetical protein B0H11DRAFT_199072 [Mycena galericulata]|nr:hypothetical protein B0H11DRAFT_199072 [Mycena galericulata]
MPYSMLVWSWCTRFNCILQAAAQQRRIECIETDEVERRRVFTASQGRTTKSCTWRRDVKNLPTGLNTSSVLALRLSRY